MRIIERIEEIIEETNRIKTEKKTIGLVPTMGALHDGHASLIETSKKRDNTTIVSIYINPLQFNNKNDLENYPHDIENDKKKLINLECDILFVPKEAEVRKHLNNKERNLNGMDKYMEGFQRPGHFAGVVAIVDFLFEKIKPRRAYFGEKDYQQLAIIKTLVEKEGYNNLEIIPCPTVRESDGLAMSSRNRLLLKEQRQQAPVIYKTLLEAQKKFATEAIPQIIEWVKNSINNNKELIVEYFEIADAETLIPARKKEEKKYVGCIAVKAGSVRLIDNIMLN